MISKLKEKNKKVAVIRSSIKLKNKFLKSSVDLAFVPQKELQRIGANHKLTHVLTGIIVKLNDAVLVSLKLVDVESGSSRHALVNCYETSKGAINNYIKELVRKLK